MRETSWLGEVISLVRSCPPDTLLVTSDGSQIPTWRLLLALNSPDLAKLLNSSFSSREGMVAISVPFPASQLNNTFEELENGGLGDLMGFDMEVKRILGFKTSFLSAKSAQSDKSDSSDNSNSRDNSNRRDRSDGETIKSKEFKPCSSPAKKLSIGPIMCLDEAVEKAPGRSPSKTSYKSPYKRSVMMGPVKKTCESVLSQQEDEVDEEYIADMDSNSTDVKEEVIYEDDVKELDFTSEEALDASSGNCLHMVEEECDCGVGERRAELKRTERSHSEQKKTEKSQHLNLVPQIQKPSDLKKGLIFPDHDTMMALIQEVTSANFSPIVTKSNRSKQHGRLVGRLIVLGCPHGGKTRSRSTGKRMRLDNIQHVDCPLNISLRERKDGTWIVTRAETEHRGHEVSEEMFHKYRKTKRLSSDQEDAVMLLLAQGAEMPEIGAMLTDFTGRQFGRLATTNLVKRFHRERAKVNSETGEKVMEFQGREIPVRMPRSPRKTVSLTAEQEGEVALALGRGAGTKAVARLLEQLTGGAVTGRQAGAVVRGVRQGTRPQ